MGQSVFSVDATLRVLLQHLNQEVQSSRGEFGVTLLVEGVLTGSVLGENLVVFLSLEDGAS